MTIRTAQWLICDLCEIQSLFCRSDLAALRLTGLREEWMTDGQTDLCPACALLYRADHPTSSEEGSL